SARCARAAANAIRARREQARRHRRASVEPLESAVSAPASRMSLVQLVGVEHSVGGPALLHDVDLSIERGERVCVVGRNGAGKSTLLRLIAGTIRADDGEVRRQAGARIAGLAQEIPASLDGSVFDVVAGGLGEAGALLA